MHGVRRGARPSEAQIEQERRRSAHAASVIRRCLALRRAPLPNPINEAFLQSYNLIETALLNNPDEYTLWAYRREVLTARLEFSSTPRKVTEVATETTTTAATAETVAKTTKEAAAIKGTVEGSEGMLAQELWQAELNLTMRALRNHPKAYPAWQHRIWLLNDLPKIDRRITAHKGVVAELNLTKLLLSSDARNFHGWAHRMRVRAIRHQIEGGQANDDQKELDFVHSKINDDFANYSAWHHRSVLLPRIEAKKRAKDQDRVGEGNDSSRRELIRKELEFVKQAFYTEPDVQSVWFYHRWLLAGAPVHGGKVVIDESILRDELAACEELIDLEPDARYAWLAKAHILGELGYQTEAFETLEKLEELVSHLHFIVLSSVDSTVKVGASPYSNIISTTLCCFIEQDPMRKGYYAYLMRKLKKSDRSVGKTAKTEFLLKT